MTKDEISRLTIQELLDGMSQAICDRDNATFKAMQREIKARKSR